MRIIVMDIVMHTADLTHLLLLAKFIGVVLDLGDLLQDFRRKHVTADVYGSSEAVQEPILREKD